MNIRSLAAVIALSIPAASLAADPQHLNVTVGVHTITATGVSPGSNVVFFGVAHVPIRGAYMHTVRRWSTMLPDSDRTGTVTFDLQEEVPRISVWAVVDVRNGAMVTTPGAGIGLRAIDAGNPLRRGKNQSIDHFVFDAGFLDLLYVHPGLGAWTWSALDGGAGDEDGPNGTTAVSLANGKAVGQSAQRPAAFAPGGVLIAVDFTRLRIAAIHVDDTLLGAAR